MTEVQDRAKIFEAEYMNPNPVPTRLTTPHGIAVMLEPWEYRKIGAWRGRTFKVTLPVEFGDRLAHTTQIARVPIEEAADDESDGDAQMRNLMRAREQGIAAASEQRKIFEARKAGEIPYHHAEPLTPDEKYDREIEKMNTGEEAPALDTKHAAPVVAEARKGTENLTNPVDAQGQPLNDEEEEPLPEAGGSGMSRKKKPKSK